LENIVFNFYVVLYIVNSEFNGHRSNKTICPQIFENYPQNFLLNLGDVLFVYLMQMGRSWIFMSFMMLLFLLVDGRKWLILIDGGKVF